MSQSFKSGWWPPDQYDERWPGESQTSLTLFSMMSASWFTAVMLNVSPVSPSKMVYSNLALSPRSASLAEIRPISAPGTASSDTEKDHMPEADKWRNTMREAASVPSIAWSATPTSETSHLAFEVFQKDAANVYATNILFR